MVLLNKLMRLRAGCIYADLLVINFGKLEWFAFMSTFTSFAQNPGFSCSVHLAGRQFLHRKLRFLHSSLTEYFCKSIHIILVFVTFLRYDCTVYLHSLMVQICLHLFCDVKNSQFLDLCSKITNRRQIDEKQPT